MDRKEWLCVLRLDDFIDIFKPLDMVKKNGYYLMKEGIEE